MAASEFRPPPAIRYEACRREHQDPILRLWSSNFPATTESVKLEDLNWALRHSPDLLVLAMSDAGQLAGTCLAGFDGQRGWLYYLCVDKLLRRRGIGDRPGAGGRAAAGRARLPADRPAAAAC